MKDIYKRIWQKARPYYLKGRPEDVEHIEWMIGVALDVCGKEGLDKELLLPLVILHDVGYARVPNVADVDYYAADIRRLHMEEGAKIAREILEEVGYSGEKLEKVVYCVSVHDNWAFGKIDLFINDDVLGTFKDLDYLWLYTKKGFEMVKRMRKKTDLEAWEYLVAEASPVMGKKPFSNETTKGLREQYLKERKQELVEKGVL